MQICSVFVMHKYFYADTFCLCYAQVFFYRCSPQKTGCALLIRKAHPAKEFLFSEMGGKNFILLPLLPQNHLSWEEAEQDYFSMLQHVSELLPLL